MCGCSARLCDSLINWFIKSAIQWVKLYVAIKIALSALGNGSLCVFMF